MRLLVCRHLNSTDLESNCFGNIFARAEAQVICHADSDCLHETVFITLLSSVLLDDVENHTIGARQPYSR